MMPGSEEFRRDIRTVRCFILAQSLLILLSMCGFVLAIAFAVGGNWREGTVTAGVCVAFAGVLICLLYRQKRLRRKATQCYTFPLPHAFGYEEVCAAIESAPGVQWRHICNENARICQIEGAFSWRVALLHLPEFSASDYKIQRTRANRIVNHARPAKQGGLCGRSCPEHVSTLWCATP